jgi:hypothetical protein
MRIERNFQRNQIVDAQNSVEKIPAFIDEASVVSQRTLMSQNTSEKMKKM